GQVGREREEGARETVDEQEDRAVLPWIGRSIRFRPPAPRRIRPVPRPATPTPAGLSATTRARGRLARTSRLGPASPAGWPRVRGGRANRRPRRSRPGAATPPSRCAGRARPGPRPQAPGTIWPSTQPGARGATP